MNTSTTIPIVRQGPDTFRFADRVLTDHISRSTMPGVCALVTNGDSDIAVWSAGWHTYDDGSTPVRADDLFDLASVTKVVSAATLCAILVDKGRLDLDRPVSEILGVTSMDSRVTPRSLLAHCSGLPAHVHLYKRLISREEVIDAVLSMDLEYEPLSQSVYSDMGYILLGAILEHVTEKPLNELFRDYVREPLGLYETVYSPTPSNRDRIVPTELDLGWRGRLIHGEVHDENAALMRGIAPHAGLFSTVGNVGRVARMWINGGEVGGRKFLSAETIKLFRSRSDLVAGSTWALGWDTVSPGGSTSGQHFSHDSYGILGYTGTSIWVDPEREVAVVLLTNRVHPTRDNWGIRELRPAFHDAVMEAVLAGGV